MLSFNGKAQTNRNLDVFKEFLNVCNSYKQLPLYLSAELKKTYNMPSVGDDSSEKRVEFYVLADGAYIHYGDYEQVINDSLALVVLGDIKQMVLSRNTSPVSEQLKLLTGQPQGDSSISSLGERYEGKKITLAENKASIEINSKGKVQGTSISRESIEIVFDPKTSNPEKVVTIKRFLVPVPAEEAATGNKIVKENLIEIPGKGSFFLYEEKTSFSYKQIDHNNKIQLPVVMGDRIIKTGDGDYIPVKMFENFSVIQN